MMFRLFCVCARTLSGIRGYGALILSDWGMVKKMSTLSIERMIHPHPPSVWTCFSGSFVRLTEFHVSSSERIRGPYPLIPTMNPLLA